MQVSRFVAKCPFEIGDKVKTSKDGPVQTITDIICVHYLKTGTIKFLYELDNRCQRVVIFKAEV